MAGQKLLAFLRPAPGRTKEFQAWQDRHMREILKAPAFIDARRYSIESTDRYRAAPEERARVIAALKDGAKASMTLEASPLEGWGYSCMTEYDFEGPASPALQQIRGAANADAEGRLYVVSALGERLGETQRPNYRVAALTNIVPGWEGEFHAWYERHVRDVLGTRGMDTAQRFQVDQVHVLAGDELTPQSKDWDHLALYDVTAADFGQVLAESARRAEAGQLDEHPSYDEGMSVLAATWPEATSARSSQ
jgi:hypothetical protein